MAQSTQPKVAIIGSGWGVRVQLDCFEKAGWKVAAIWVRSEEKVADIRAVVPESRVALITADYSAILNDPSIDLISIVTPPGAHLDMASRALLSGKHVLCDKPTALHADQALQMAKFARDRPHQLSLIDHELRFLSNYRRMRHFVATGEQIGALRRIEVTVQYRPQRNQTWNWWQDKAAGGGLLGAIGSHYIDLVTYIAKSGIRSVCGTVKTIIPTLPDPVTGEQRENTADHFASFNFTMENGVFGTIHLSIVQHLPPNHRLTLHGSNATAVMEQTDLTVYNEDGVVLKEVEPAAPEPVQQNVWAIGTYRLACKLAETLTALKEMNQIADANGVLPDAATFEDGLYTQTVLDAVRKSSETGMTVFV